MRVVVTMEDGLVTGVFAEQPGIEVMVVDYRVELRRRSPRDEHRDPNLVYVDDEDGGADPAFGTIQVATVDQRLVTRTHEAFSALATNAPAAPRMAEEIQNRHAGVANCQGDSLEACAASLLAGYRDLLRDGSLSGLELHKHFAGAVSAVNECFLDQTGGGVWVSTTIHETPYGRIFVQAGDCSAEALRATKETAEACFDEYGELCGVYNDLQLAEVGYDRDVIVGPQTRFQAPGM